MEISLACLISPTNPMNRLCRSVLLRDQAKSYHFKFALRFSFMPSIIAARINEFPVLLNYFELFLTQLSLTKSPFSSPLKTSSSDRLFLFIERIATLCERHK